MACQRSYTIFNAFSNLRQSLPRLDIPLCPLPDLSVDLRTLPVIAKEIRIHSVQMALLFIGSAESILISVVHYFTLRILAVCK